MENAGTRNVIGKTTYCALAVADKQPAVARPHRRFLRARLHPIAEQAERIILPSDRA